MTGTKTIWRRVPLTTTGFEIWAISNPKVIIWDFGRKYLNYLVAPLLNLHLFPPLIPHLDLGGLCPLHSRKTKENALLRVAKVMSICLVIPIAIVVGGVEMYLG